MTEANELKLFRPGDGICRGCLNVLKTDQVQTSSEITLDKLINDCDIILKVQPIHFHFEEPKTDYARKVLEEFKDKVSKLIKGRFIETKDPLTNDISIRITDNDVNIVRNRSGMSGLIVK